MPRTANCCASPLPDRSRRQDSSHVPPESSSICVRVGDDVRRLKPPIVAAEDHKSWSDLLLGNLLVEGLGSQTRRIPSAGVEITGTPIRRLAVSSPPSSETT